VVEKRFFLSVKKLFILELEGIFFTILGWWRNRGFRMELLHLAYKLIFPAFAGRGPQGLLLILEKNIVFYQEIVYNIYKMN